LSGNYLEAVVINIGVIVSDVPYPVIRGITPVESVEAIQGDSLYRGSSNHRQDTAPFAGQGRITATTGTTTTAWASPGSFMWLQEDPAINFSLDFALAMGWQIIAVSFGAFLILMYLINKNSVS